MSSMCQSTTSDVINDTDTLSAIEERCKLNVIKFFFCGNCLANDIKNYKKNEVIFYNNYFIYFSLFLYDTNLFCDCDVKMFIDLSQKFFFFSFIYSRKFKSNSVHPSFRWHHSHMHEFCHSSRYR